MTLVLDLVAEEFSSPTEVQPTRAGRRMKNAISRTRTFKTARPRMTLRQRYQRIREQVSNITYLAETMQTKNF